MLVSIYQISDSKFETCGYAFSSLKFAKDHGFNLDDYENVYNYFTIDFPRNENGYSAIIGEAEKKTMLNKIFEKFNTNVPKDFKGHSLSMSDLVMLDTDIYYCDRFGWEKLN